MTLSELMARLQAAGVAMTPYQVKLATSTSPPSRVYGLNHYEERHFRMAVAYGQARGLVIEQAQELHE